MADTTFQRARSPERKQARREHILDVAAQLAADDRVGNVTLGAIAKAVGISHSNVLGYFETREDIYLHICAREWASWVDTLALRVETVRADPAHLARLLTETLIECPLLCDLLGQTPISLEHHVSVDAARSYKLSVLASVQRASDLCRQALPQLGKADAFEIVAAVTLLAGSLWQVAHPPASLADLYAGDPELAAGCVDFASTLTRLGEAATVGVTSRYS